MIFDTHAHYDDKKFDADRREVLAAMPAKGVSLIVDPGCDGESSRAAFPFVYAAVGWHPEEWQSWNGESMALLRSLCAQPKVVAIGEIGLDYHYEGYDRGSQSVLLREQLDLAKQLDLPVIIHARDCTEDYLRILQEFRPRGVVHCFSGSAETAREVLKLGMYIGFTGVLTFKNAKKALKALAEVPEDKLVLETDCPYLAPVPNRGKRNSSLNLPYVVEELAAIKKMDPKDIIKATTENAKRLYRITDM